MARAETILEIDAVVTRFGEQTVHDGVSFTLKRGTLAALIGGSGTGKSVLLREIIALQRPTAGTIRLLGTDVWQAPESELNAIRRRFGMMFQDGALFSSLTVAQNVAVPLLEHANVQRQQRHDTHQQQHHDGSDQRIAFRRRHVSASVRTQRDDVSQRGFAP